MKGRFGIRRLRRFHPNLLVTISFVLLFLHFLLRYAPSVVDHSLWPKDSGVDVVGLAIFLIAVLPLIADYLTSAKLPGGIDIQFNKIKERQNLTDDNLKKLKFIIEGFLTDDEYRHLLNLELKTAYIVQEEHSTPLAAELRKLRAMNLISGKRDHNCVTDFVAADGQPKIISDWFTMTHRGQEYLSMRSESQKPKLQM